MDSADDFDFFYNDLDFDEDDSMEHVDDERDDCGRDLSDDEGAEKQDPIQLSNVRTAKARLEGTNILEKVKNILKCMKEEGLPLPLFLDALCWGDSDCGFWRVSRPSSIRLHATRWRHRAPFAAAWRSGARLGCDHQAGTGQWASKKEDGYGRKGAKGWMELRLSTARLVT
ncbi:hypothetical protein B0H10DRAFT_2236161 [Mycena sp. CBHHK59/15]|nr:hypothetical protein B0H10DRAFT_2236161 [Mycena sp. CBHHK59/15]